MKLRNLRYKKKFIIEFFVMIQISTFKVNFMFSFYFYRKKKKKQRTLFRKIFFFPIHTFCTNIVNIIIQSLARKRRKPDKQASQ